jgi:ADP-ribose pyrophosphatase
MVKSKRRTAKKTDIQKSSVKSKSSPGPAGKAAAASLPETPVRKKLKIDPGRSAVILTSKVAYKGPLFRVVTDQIREPNGNEVRRDIIRHNGSVVVLPIDRRKSKKDPLVLIERQYRHAAQQYLYEVPAGTLDPGEEHLDAARRELIEETGYQARKWTKLTRYFASPGFLGEWMEVFLAEDLIAGEAQPEEDESLELQFVSLSELLRLIEAGRIQDGKTIIAVLLYARLARQKGR